jgi:transposase
MRNVALDLGARRIDFCEIRDGVIVQRATVSSIAKLERWLGPNTPPAVVAFEACREGWHVAGVLDSWGHQPVMVDTTRSKQLGIGQHGRKSDRIDTEALAHALEERRIPQAHLLSPQRRELRFQLGVRRALVETRAGFVSSVREIVRARGHRIPSCATEAFVGHVTGVKLDEGTRQLIEPLCEVLRTLEAKLVEVDLKLEQLCAGEEFRLLATAPGVALVVSAAFVSVVDEARRFRSAHHLESYLGLVPGEDSSGGKRRLGSISKQGNTYLRAMLVQAAWHVLRHPAPDDPLSSWAQQVSQRRGKRIAVVAVARRLAGILWAMWRTRSVYDPARLARQGARGLQEHAQSLELRAARLRQAERKLTARKRRVERLGARGNFKPERASVPRRRTA